MQKQCIKLIIGSMICILFAGCSAENDVIGDMVSNFSGEEIYPGITNEALGVELPANAITEWEIDDLGFAKYIKYSLDPHKRAHSYVKNRSADIEKIICIDQDIDEYEEEKKSIFEGTWVTGLYETDGNYEEDDVVPAENIDRNKTQLYGVIKIWYDSEINGYQFKIDHFILKKCGDNLIEELKNRNWTPDQIMYSVARISAPDNHGWGSAFDENTICQIQGNKMILKGNSISTNGYGFVELELEYDENYKTLIVHNYKIETDNPHLSRLLFAPFGGYDHKDILKRYDDNSETDLQEGLLQIRMEQLLNKYPELDNIDKYKVLERRRCLIPGTVDLTKEPAMPEFPDGE